MSKIDRLGWAAGLSFVSYGLRVGVRANTSDALGLVRDHIPPGWKPSPHRGVDRLYSLILGGDEARRGVRRFNVLYGNIARLARTQNSDEALATFESDLQLYVAEMARRRVFIHAGELRYRSSSQLLITMLAGSWRFHPTALDCSLAELHDVAPLLQRSGAAALCWRRLQDSVLRNSPTATTLHHVYRFNILHAAISHQTITHVINHLRSFGSEPMLVKGWAASRLYPEEGLRPYGDIDLCVRPEQYVSAEMALKNLPERRYEVDLHRGFASLGGGNPNEIYARSVLVELGETRIRVPSSEDHLRMLCIHFLREGGWRPLWLCDIAAAVENRPADFDWNYCLGKNRRQANWIICTLRVANRLLDADVSGTPATRSSRPLPRWLIPTILKEWESPSPSMSQRHRAPMAGFFRNPSGILKGLRHRWPNPIEATISVRGPFNELPRIPFQVGNCLARTAKFAARLPSLMRGR